MKAAWYSRNGTAREVLMVGEVPDPRPGEGEVRVKLFTSGVNPSDVKSRTSRPMEAEKVIPHSDGAGVIDMVGRGVSDARIGERVWIWNGQWKRPLGTACELIALPQDQAVGLPDHVSFEAGACLGIPALTAIQALRLAGPLDGRTILVTGAGNNVGNYITQLAAMQGAHVIGTVGSAMRLSLAKKCGAHDLIHYKTERIAQRILDLTQGVGVDAVLDMDFSSTSKLLEKGILKPHGHMVVYGSNVAIDVPVNYRSLLRSSINLKFFLIYDLVDQDRKIGLEQLSGLLRANSLHHEIGARFTLEEIAFAHEAVESGQVVGNVVLTMS